MTTWASTEKPWPVVRQQVLASPLFDAPRFARNFEVALWGMWREKGLVILKSEPT